MTLSRDHWLRSGLCSAVSEAAQNLRTLRDVKHLAEDICACEYVTDAKDSENGSVLWRGADRGADRRQSLL